MNTDDNKEERQYLNLIQKILDEGFVKKDRTGVGTKSLFGASMRFSLRNGELPLVTTKRVYWKAVVHELLWFISGSTDEKKLAEVNVNIWKKNSEKGFLQSVGLGHREEGDLGPVYGFQWRHFGATYKDFKTDYSGQGVDQLKNVIDLIQNDPDSRRIIMSAWNPVDIPQMALPPCHCLVQFYVSNGELSCQLYQRSADMGLGVPFNIASYSLLTHMIAHVVGLKAGEFIHVIGDAHVYLNHETPLRLQLAREPRNKPKIKFQNEVKNIEDIQFEDIVLIDYNPHPKISMDMAV